MRCCPNFFLRKKCTENLTLFLLVSWSINQDLSAVGLDKALARALVVELMGEFACLD